MKHNTDTTASNDHSENSRMKMNMKRGIEAWFDVDDITIHIWASSWTGREVVTLRVNGQDRIVSDKRSWRLNTPHEFDHDGHRYQLKFRVGFGTAAVELYRDGALIDSDKINRSGIRIDPATGRLDWGHAMKKLALPLVVGIIVGVTFGYGVGVILE